MKTVSGKVFTRLLLARGWELKRVSGSYHIFSKAGRIETISVPVHGNTDLKSGLQRKLMQIAGIQEEDL